MFYREWKYNSISLTKETKNRVNGTVRGGGGGGVQNVY